MPLATSPEPPAVDFHWSEFETIASESPDPSKALTEMVRRVANHLDVDVCSIYVVEGEDLVLKATMGLNQSSVNIVRMHHSEGLVGLVAESGEPVFVAEAAIHPRFKYFPDAGEDPYVSFLGSPIAWRTKLIGVVVLQTVESRNLLEELSAITAVARRIAPHVRRCKSAR